MAGANTSGGSTARKRESKGTKTTSKASIKAQTSRGRDAPKLVIDNDFDGASTRSRATPKQSKTKVHWAHLMDSAQKAADEPERKMKVEDKLEEKMEKKEVKMERKFDDRGKQGTKCKGRATGDRIRMEVDVD